MGCGHAYIPYYADGDGGPQDTGELDDAGWSLPTDTGTDPTLPPLDPSGTDPGKILDFSPVVSKPIKPPPISGGTLLVTHDGHTVLASDPDRDRVVAVDVTTRKVLFTVALDPKSEPGRLVEDSHGVVHVVLRGTGVVAAIDLASHAVTARRELCAAPRGLAFDPKLDALFVACLGGELVFEPLGAGTRVVNRIADDLRDVAVDEGKVYVTRHRAAELLEVDRTSLVVTTRKPVTVKLTANTAARLRPRRAGGFYVLHQRSTMAPITEEPKGAYGGPCPPVQTVVTTFEPGKEPTSTAAIAGAVVPVDLAESLDGKSTLVIAPGAAKRGGAQLFKVPNTPDKGVGCPIVFEGGRIDAGEAIAIDLTPSGHLVVQTREPSALVIDGVALSLGGESAFDTGHQVFHSATVSASLACASCHPEGADDGLVWQFEKSGGRRTQSLRGAILATAPFHWDGAMGDFVAIMDTGYGKRMLGGMQPLPVIQATAAWVESIAPVAHGKPTDAASVARGKELFEGAAQGCTSCHSGALTTNNTTVTLTDQAIQVPWLRGVAFRGPWLHNGCATTLAATLDGCGMLGKHGNIVPLGPGARADLVRYLETL